MFEKKLKLTLFGYLFTLLNLYMTTNGKTIVGVAFGLVACVFFIKSLLIRNK
jgi:hypothetical protein